MQAQITTFRRLLAPVRAIGALPPQKKAACKQAVPSQRCLLARSRVRAIGDNKNT